MGVIRLNIDAVLAQSHDIAAAKNTVSEVKSSIDSLYHQIDHKILARNNIGGRMKTVSNQLGGIRDKVSQIQGVVESGVNNYYSTEIKAVQRANTFVQK